MRPFVYMNMAMTADGKITSADREHSDFTTDLDRKIMDRLRAEADALLIGAGTLRADDPPLHVRHPDMQEYRRSLGKPDGLINIVVTATGNIDTAAGFFTSPRSADLIVATCRQIPRDREDALKEVAKVWKVGEQQVDMPALLERLQRNGVERLLVEGGGELNWAFVEHDLLDELYVTVAPALLGGRSAPTLLEGEGFPMENRVVLTLVEMLQEGDEIYCKYAVKH